MPYATTYKTEYPVIINPYRKNLSGNKTFGTDFALYILNR